MILIDMYIVGTQLMMGVMNQLVIFAWINLFSLQFQFQQNLLIEIDLSAKYLLQFDCRKIYFQHYLNDQHDEVLRRIEIRDVLDARYTYIFQRSENNTNDPYLFQRSEGNVFALYNEIELTSLLDFIVVVPAALVYNEQALIIDIDRFALPGLQYEIVIE